MLRSLPARPPGITAQELVDLLDDAGFAVSKRTIERDLIELSNLFPLQCNDKSAPYGWYWTPGATAELPGLTLSEALARQLRETPLTGDMRLQADGDGHHLSATLQDSWQLRWWLLSQTGKIVVHEPQVLHEALRSQLETGLQMYRDGIAATTVMPAQASAS